MSLFSFSQCPFDVQKKKKKKNSNNCKSSSVVAVIIVVVGGSAFSFLVFGSFFQSEDLCLLLPTAI